MHQSSGIELSKHWDEARSRMMLLVKNGPATTGATTVEDSYPDGLSGVLCFARTGGITPRATASAGKITWQLSGMKPGEIRELVYTTLPRAALNDPAVPKRPSDRDRALLGAASGLSPRLIEDEPPTVPVPQPDPIVSPEPPREKSSGMVVSIGAGKGGTGKTTFAINFAIALAEHGFKVVLLDADTSMGNLGPYMGIDVQSMRATLHEVLSGEAEPEKAVYRAFHENLRVVPSGLSISGFLKMDRNLLEDVIGHFSTGSDFIVIDTPAGYNKEVALSLKSSDYLILVLNPDEGSMIDGLKVQEMARILGVKIPGIVLNRYDMKGHQYSKSQIEAHFDTRVIAMLPEDGNMRRKDRVPAVLASPGSRTAGEINRVALLLSGGEESSRAEARPFASRLMEALFKA